MWSSATPKKTYCWTPSPASAGLAARGGETVTGQDHSSRVPRPDRGRALFYHRDSGGKHEMTPGQYVQWARRQAEQNGLSFSGGPEQLEAMIRDGRSAEGDLFLDFAVK